MKKFALGLALVFVFSSLLIGNAQASGKLPTSKTYAEAEEVTVTGTLVRMVAICGETTGWAIVLFQPLAVRDDVLNKIEIDFLGADISRLEGLTVTVTGTLVKRQGIERGSYWVLEVRLKQH